MNWNTFWRNTKTYIKLLLLILPYLFYQKNAKLPFQLLHLTWGCLIITLDSMHPKWYSSSPARTSFSRPRCLIKDTIPAQLLGSEPWVYPGFLTLSQASHSPTSNPVISDSQHMNSSLPLPLSFLASGGLLASLLPLLLLLPSLFSNNGWNGLFKIKLDQIKLLIDAVKTVFGSWWNASLFIYMKYILTYVNIQIHEYIWNERHLILDI